MSDRIQEPPTKVAIALAALRWGTIEGLNFARTAFVTYRLCISTTCVRTTRSGIFLPDGTLLPLCGDCWRDGQVAARTKRRRRADPTLSGRDSEPDLEGRGTCVSHRGDGGLR